MFIWKVRESKSSLLFYNNLFLWELSHRSKKVTFSSCEEQLLWGAIVKILSAWHHHTGNEAFDTQTLEWYCSTWDLDFLAKTSCVWRWGCGKQLDQGVCVHQLLYKVMSLVSECVIKRWSMIRGKSPGTWLRRTYLPFQVLLSFSIIMPLW